jgi:MioC protein
MQLVPEAKRNRGCIRPACNRLRERSLGLDLTILIGTMTGTAQLVAQELELRLDDGDTTVRAVLMDDLTADAIEPNRLYLICSSTYGQGDVPDNAKRLYESLQSRRPDLSSVTYGVIALGDRTYHDTFCNGGRRFDRILSELGARRIGDILLHDASAGTMPEEVAVEWIDGWMALCREQAGADASA